MPAEPRDPSDPETWLLRARSNLARARAGRVTPDILYEDLCFDAQQAVEKSLKALLISRGVDFPRTHAISDLLSLLESRAVSVPDKLRASGVLTAYAVETPYPGSAEDVTEEEFREALLLAEVGYQWVRRMIDDTMGTSAAAPL